LPTSSVTIGSQTLPLEAGGVDSPISDPRAVGFLSYFGFWIKQALDTKLAEMGGPTASGAYTDACPVPYRFAWNHCGNFMRPHPADGTMQVPLPGLWIWCERTVPSQRYSTLLYRAYEHTYRLNYIFPPLAIPDGYNARSGLTATIGNALMVACDKGRHPLYGYGADADGTPLVVSLDLMAFDYVGGVPGMFEPTPTTGKNGKGRGGAVGAEIQFYPAYDMTFTVVDRVGDWVSDPVADAMPDVLVSIEESELEILERVLVAPEDTL
jgi:hypothetical protein